MDRRLQYILGEARSQEASDVLLQENRQVVYRIHGKLKEVSHDMTKEEMVRFMTYLRPPGFVQEYIGGPPQVMDVAFEEKGRYRANFFTSMGRYCAVVRVIKEEIPSLHRLGLPDHLPQRILEKKGLSLIVGKTGAGKSTTLAALTKELMERERLHIITLEDPVEFTYPEGQGRITQREMGTDFNGFEMGIHDALRQSPDFIVIGEIRTLGALKAAITASEAGHGILGTMHSFGAQRTLTRMLSMFMEQEKEFVRYQLSTNLNFILSQQLLHEPGDTKLNYELLINTSSVENTIREGRFHHMGNLILLGERQGMKAFD